MASENIKQIFESFLPNVYIGRVMLESGSDDTVVSVNLSIKDLSTKNFLSYWARDRAVQDLLEIRYAVATTPEQAQSILRTNQNLDMKPFQFRFRSRSPMEPTISKVGMSALSDDFQNESYKTLDNEGNEIVTYNFQERFQIPEDTRYLAVFACCRLKIDQFFGDSKESLRVSQEVIDSIDPSLFAGKLSYNIVLENGQIASYMPIYLDEETGEIWNGPVHRMGDEGRWMTGLDHGPNSRLLTLQKVPNTRVQDFRKSSTLSGMDLSIFKTEDAISRAFLKNVRGDRVGVNNPKSYFSDIFLSQDEMGRARFFFSVNYDRILEDNITFGGLIRKSAPDTNLRDYCKIVSMKIYRSRVDGSPEIGSQPYKKITTINADPLANFDPATGPGVFNCNQVDQLVVSTGKLDGLVRARNTLNNQDIGSIEEIDNLGISNGRGIRHFSGIDYNIEKVTDGYYQYRIELEIIDSSDNFIRDRLVELEEAKRLMENYLNAVMESKMVGRSAVLDIFEGRSEKISEAVLTYLNNLVLFTDSPMFSQTFSIRSLYTRILSWCNPRTPNGISKAIELMDDLTRRLSDVGNITKTENLSKTENTTNIVKEAAPLQNYSAPKVAFKVENTFNTYFNSNIQKDTYYDYMGALSSATDFGVKVVNNSFWRDRVQAETEKVSGTEGLEKDLEVRVEGQILNPGDNYRFTDFTFFSPAEVKVSKDESLKLTGQSPLIPLNPVSLKSFDMTKKGFGKPITTLSKPLETSSKEKSPAQVRLAKSVSSKMASFGVVSSPVDVERSFDSEIADPADKERTNCNEDADTQAEIEAAPLYERLFDEVSLGSRVIDGPYSTTGEATKDQSKSLFKKNLRNAGTYYNANSGEGLVSSFMSEFPTFTPSHLFLGAPHSNELTIADGWNKTVPNHIKSLVKGTSLPEGIQKSIRDVKSNIASQIEIELKFLNLIAVQVLTEFEDTDKDGWVEPYLPVFQPMTREIYNNAARDRKKLLCKLKRIENSMLNVKTPDDNFAIIDQYFIIEPTEVVPEVVSIDPTDTTQGTTETTETIPEGRLGTGNRPTLDIDLSPPDTARTQVDPVDSFRETTETIPEGRLGTTNRPTLDIDLGDFAETRVVTIEPRLLFNPEVELVPNFSNSPTLNFGLDELEDLEEEEESSESTSTASPARSNLSFRGGPRYGS